MIDDFRADLSPLELPTPLRTYRFDIRDQTGSTQTELEAAVERGDACDGQVLVTDAQTLGRGRRGRTWASPPGVNLYASIALDLPVPLPRALQYQFVAALSVFHSLCRETGQDGFWIKWPNDIWRGERKLAGILLTAHNRSDSATSAVLGIGINVNATADQLPAEASSLLMECGRVFNRGGLLVRILRSLTEWEDVWRSRGWNTISDAWQRASRVAGCEASVPGLLGGEGQLLILGLGEYGELLVEDATGRRRTLTQADVSIRMRKCFS